MAAPAFADVLDRKTGIAHTTAAPAPTADSVSQGMPLWGAQAVWLYELASFGLTATPHSQAAQSRALPRSAVGSKRGPAQDDRRPNGRSPRILPFAALEALSFLRALGATQLRDDFDQVDLKRAFRQLALELHPDRHTSATPDERRQFAKAFADMTAAVNSLLAIGSA